VWLPSLNSHFLTFETETEKNVTEITKVHTNHSKTILNHRHHNSPRVTVFTGNFLGPSSSFSEVVKELREVSSESDSTNMNTKFFKMRFYIAMQTGGRKSNWQNVTETHYMMGCVHH
jgi:hypothetical protein